MSREDRNKRRKKTLSAPKRAKPKTVKHSAGSSEFMNLGKPVDVSLDAAQISLWEWNAKTNHASWSKNINKRFGLTSIDFDGSFEAYLNLIHPEDKSTVRSEILNALKSGQSLECEHRVIWPDKSVHWVRLLGKTSLKSKTIGGTMQDITERKAVEFDLEDWKTRHELITSSAGIVIYDYNIRTGEVIWSGNCQEVLGYSPVELGNLENWGRLIHPKDRPQAYELLEEAKQQLSIYDIHYRFRSRSRGYVFLHNRGFMIPGGNGKAVRMLGMMSDATDRVKSQKAIVENTKFRESLENAMPGILYVYDVVNREIVYANRSILSYLGYSLADLKKLGSDFLTKVLHPDDFDKLSVWTDEPDGTVKEAEQRILRRDGYYRCFLTRDTPFKRDKDGNVVQVIGIAQDITIRKEVMNQLNQSEESYRELFDTVGEAIFIQRLDQTFIDINEEVTKSFGYSKKELVGASPALLAASELNDLEEMNKRFSHAAAGEAQSVEFWARTKSGQTILLDVRLTKGTYFGQDIIIATARDITARRNAELALRESEQRFRTLQEASFGGIGLHDQGIILDCNQGLCEVTGYKYEELIGSNGLNLIAPEWRGFVMDKIRSGYDKTYDVEGIRKDGTRYALEIHGKNIPYLGKIIRVTEFRDITERKKTEAQIIEQNLKLVAVTEDLLRKNDQLEEFTHIVSHNLRAPVGNITTLLTFFENAKSDEERAEYFKHLKDSSITTLTMLNDVNEVLKIKQTKNIEQKELKFDTVLQQVRSMLNAKITQRSAEISTHFEAQEIMYPAIYLESIMLNLLDNALKYSHPERKPRIRFKTYSNRNGNILMEVSDNGLGVNLDKYGHQIFKLRKTFHRHPESRGIGLFMIKNQIEAMGGDITLQSKENEGSVFFINFNKHH